MSQSTCFGGRGPSAAGAVRERGGSGAGAGRERGGSGAGAVRERGGSGAAGSEISCQTADSS